MTRPLVVRKNGETGSVPKRWYTEKELSVYGGIPVKTLQAWRCRRQGPPFAKMPTGGVRYAIEAFDAWMMAGNGGADHV